MNALRSIGTKVVATLVLTGLAVGSAFAATGTTLTVTLPEGVTVGNVILAGGQYTITETINHGGSGMFIFRSDKGESVAALGMRVAEPAADQKTELVIANDGGSPRLDRMFIEGDSAGYQFAQADEGE